MLAALGYEPVGFDQPAQAVAACRADPSRFDAILVGHSGPAEHGLQLARTLHEIANGRPILLTMASTGQVCVRALAEAGVAAILSHPLVSTELADALARGLHSTSRLRL